MYNIVMEDEMVKRVETFFFLVLFLFSLSPGEEIASRGVVIKSVENMYRKASQVVDVVSQAIIGTNVKILKSEKTAEGEEWFLIETPDTYQGWVKSSSIRVYKEGEKLYGQEGNVFDVKTLVAYIYRNESVSDYEPLAFAPISACLEVGNCGERWCEVNLPSGEKGWIQKGDGIARETGSKRKRLSPDEMIVLARRFLGLPYLWGGTTPLGFDCSGFSQLICRLSGIEILRDASIQFEKSGLLEVRKGKEKKGDLVFFGRSIDKIIHVGIMINKKEFIHSTPHVIPVIQISKLQDPYWMKIYQGARRLPQ